MKQGTAKVLGAVVLGAAIAATAAGTAVAAPAGTSNDGVLHRLPVKEAAKTLSGATSKKGDGNGVKTNLNSKGNKLLGGLPTSAVAKTLHLGG
ncbi:hypothetical protein [Streptomyces sp. NPDC093097]|uniref:hypothetical protein n=1 Tax=Streptomyces sp. NPDC093097 TaxID=3366027 RepID=UPI0037FA754E